jgi:hypothetical protein
MPVQRLLLALAALLLGYAAVSGTQFSSATYTSTSARPVQVTASQDWTPPTVAMTDPGSPLSGTVTVSATASDARSSVASVVIQYAPNGSSTWTTICAAATTPYSCPWATTAVADGTYQLRAVATDTAGYSATSTGVTTSVLNNATVDLATVADNVRGAVTLSVTVAGSGGATVTTRVEIAPAGSGSWATIGGCGNATGTARTCTWTTAGYTSGETYDLRAVAVIGSKTVYDTQPDVTVDNTQPTITLSVPGQPLYGAVDLTATADDGETGVASVLFEYKANAAGTWTSCGTDATAPYACRLTTTALANGTYNFRATATDLAGNATVTNVTTRTVDNSAPSTSISSPATGVTIAGGPTTVTADAYAPAGVTSVRIDARVAGGTFAAVCTDTSAPYSCDWATGTLASGSYELRSFVTAGNNATATSATVSVTVDNATLKAQDVQTVNVGTLGKPEAGDQVQLTYSAVVDLTSIKAGWTGTSTSVATTLKDANVTGGGTGLDRLELDSNLGHVTFAQNLVKGNKTVTLTGSTMTAATVLVNGVNVTRVTITLGTPSSTTDLRTGTAGGFMKWYPTAGVKLPTGQTCSLNPATESGTSDRDF